MKAFKTPKMNVFLTMDHRNVVLENFFSDIGDVMLVRNLFIAIGVINRTISQSIWTPTCEDIGHIAKSPSFVPPKKNPHVERKNYFLTTQREKLFQNE